MIENFIGKQIMVTGATGLIGRRLVQNLLKIDSVHVLAVSRDLNRLKLCFADHLLNPKLSFLVHDVSIPFSSDLITFDFIFHAGSPQEANIINNSPVDTINANLLGTINCLNILKKQKECKKVEGRFILFSSITIYGNISAKKIRVKETDTQITESLDSNKAPYSQSKRMTEVIAKAYSKQFGIDIVISRLSTVYGYSVIKTNTAFFEFLKNGLSGKDIYIQNASHPRRDNIFLDDAVSGLITVAIRGKKDEVYNISSNGELGNFLAVDEIAIMISKEINKRADTFKKKIKVIYKEQNYVRGKSEIILDNSKLKKLGWVVSTSFRDGISKILDFELHNN